MDMESFLDTAVRLTEKICPSFYERVDVAIRSRIKYQQLKRNKPLPPKQVYDDGPLVSAHRQEQDIKRWKRNLKRYAKMYEKARVPGINPPADTFIDNDL